MQYLTLAAIVASIISGAAATGNAIVHNKCTKPMYLWSVGDSSSSQVALPDHTVAYHESYRSRKAGGGISIKVCNTPELTDNQTQFEYTLDTTKIWYDLSNINGNALNGVDYELKASDPDCPVVHCPATDAKCKAVYNVWNDDASTHACSADSDLIFTLCPENTSANTTTDDSSSGKSEPASVTYSGSGPLGESAPPEAKVAAVASKVANSGLSDVKWLSPSFPSKRDAEVEAAPAGAAAHAHAQAHAQHKRHENLRRSRIFRAGEQA